VFREGGKKERRSFHRPPRREKKKKGGEKGRGHFPISVGKGQRNDFGEGGKRSRLSLTAKKGRGRPNKKKIEEPGGGIRWREKGGKV